jgi:4-hydroxy-3-methylbut-2-en-1-yl diphosphate reductase
MKKILLCNPRGFCAGVVRAIQTVEKALEIWGAPIYVKHQIVHNKHVVKKLKEKGAVFIEDLNEVPNNCKIIYSAHGVTPQVREDAKKRGLVEIDATCGLVTKIHSAVKRYSEKGYKIILIGHRKHVEIVGTAAEAINDTFIIDSKEEVEKLNFYKDQKLFYVTQTTLSIDDVKEITDALKQKYPDIQTLPSSSICYATTNRQMALKHIAGDVDVIFVIGDPSSSNSNRLKEVALKKNKKAYLINDPLEIKKEYLDGVSTIGMTAGASTPEDVVQGCIKKIQSIEDALVKEIIYKEENVVFKLPEMTV